ncbi:MAG TPA: hypothetical protein VFM94_09375 [Solirubrobacterales bacterium]|nr:hypothetical protein [Solirubrobacterales bacterium]
MSVGSKAFVTLVVAVATISAGCGDESSTSTPDAVTKAEFIAKANAACEKERDGLEKRVRDFERQLAARNARPLPYADMVHFVLLPTIEGEIRRIYQLDLPPADEEQIDAMLSTKKFALDQVAVIPRVPSRKVAERHFVEADKLFRAYGLTSCASSSG